MRKLKTAVLSSILVLLLCASQPLHAGLFLSVDFDINEPGIQNQARADNQGNVTAWIVLFLTGNTDMYAYEFSVRYNSDRLTLISKDDNPPPNVNGKPFVESLSGENSKSGSGGGFDHYIEINRFDGKIDNNFDVITSADIPENGLVLGVLNFTVIDFSTKTMAY